MRRIYNLLPSMMLALALLGCSDTSEQEAAVGSVAEEPAMEMDASTTDDGPVPAVSAAAVVSRLGSDTSPLLLDVRTPEEFAAGHIPGAVNIPYDELEHRLGELADMHDAEIIVYCRTGRRAKIAEQVLVDAGFASVFDLDGHMAEWMTASHPVSDPRPCC
jgi:rhodanese-related sulfurtransferase